MTELDEEINEFWLSNNFSIKFFSELEANHYLSSLNDESGMPPKGTNIMFRHIKIKNPISKTQLIDMSDEEMKLYLQMNEDAWKTT